MKTTPTLKSSACTATISVTDTTVSEDSGQETADPDTPAVEEDESPSNLTIAMPHHDDSYPFYELIAYVFQKAKGVNAILPSTIPRGISLLHREMYLAAMEELKRPGPVMAKKEVL
ncbi:hypothetical protein BGW42_006593 [Actinomortierella wolfii]|nr:hypothetical protein BGW42_006593 [Actinomortierella wolfii]